MKYALARHNALLERAIKVDGSSTVYPVNMLQYFISTHGARKGLATARIAATCFTSSATDSARCSSKPATRAAARWLPSGHCTRKTGAKSAPPCVRMGLHTGSAEAHNGDYVASLTLARTQRVAAAAHGGQTLLSSAAADHVRDGLPSGTTLRDLGIHKLRGIAEPETINQLVAPDLPSEFPPLRVENVGAAASVPYTNWCAADSSAGRSSCTS